MAKRQTRRQISMSGRCYQRWKNFCERNGIPMARELERIMVEHLDHHQEPDAKQPNPYPNTKTVCREDIISQHFTF